ncbi:hypothetical protein ABZ464_29535 [Streptomyces sp. NPDC005820]|uniref:hypothetical protein n=1 Tax=Streptomyces sp. NPDC005820 TaxID=3157069 RepID=UPI00340456BD
MQGPLPRRSKGPSAIAAASARGAGPGAGDGSEEDPRGAAGGEPEAEEQPAVMSSAAESFVAELGGPEAAAGAAASGGRSGAAVRPGGVRRSAVAGGARDGDDRAGTVSPGQAAAEPALRRRLPRAALFAGVGVLVAALIAGVFVVRDGGDSRSSAAVPGAGPDHTQGGGTYGPPPSVPGSASASASASVSASPSADRKSASPKASSTTDPDTAGTSSGADDQDEPAATKRTGSGTGTGAGTGTGTGSGDSGSSCSSGAGSGPITDYSICLSSGTVTFRASFHASDSYYHVFIDTDGDTSTGYQLPYPSPSALGADYMIENGGLYRSRSTQWSWSELGTSPSMAVSGSTRTWTLPLRGIGSPSGTQRVEFHVGSDYTSVVSFTP